MLDLRIDSPWNTHVKLIHPSDELPLPSHIETLFLDLETTSGDVKLSALNPHKNCKILGVAALFDDEPYPYYVPVRHIYLGENGERLLRDDYPNVSVERVHNWLRELFRRTKVWVNQNLKYDCHVIINEAGFDPCCKLVDTLTLAKLSEFVEQMDYSLDNIMKLFGIDITPYEKELKRFLGTKIKDYAVFSPDRMACYAAVDVLSCRYIKRNIKIHKECTRVLEMEHKITEDLIQMEQIGLHVDIPKIVETGQQIVPTQMQRIQRIKELSGLTSFDPSKKRDLKKLFCDTLKWELDWTEKSYVNFTQSGDIYDLTPSFSEDSISKHKAENPELVKTWKEYLKDEKLLTSYVFPYLESHVDNLGLIKCSFNQIVRTGRMSCRTPNFQQLDKRSKAFIIPYTEDYVLIEFDLSQIEFRLLVHYLDNKAAIKAFNEDPTTDYHDWIANGCGVERDLAKRVNFGSGYGAGRDKIFSILSTDDTFLANLNGSNAREKSDGICSQYHHTLPELKPTRNRATAVCKSRGYVRTLLNRHRNLPPFIAHIALPSVCQGSAADILKDITLRLRQFQGIDCILQLLVHDSFLFSIKKERVKELVPLIKAEIERPIEGVNLSVPLLSKYKVCPERWSIEDKEYMTNA